MARRTHRFWRRCRVYFRRFRISLWLLVLALLGTLIYVNQVGLPGFVKKPLLEKLRERGLNLQFSRLRLRWYEGIVAENVRFEHADEPLSPRLTVSEVKVGLNAKALQRLQFQVDAVNLRQGRLVWPISGTNTAPKELSVENINTFVRFLPDDQWELDNFKAQFAGVSVVLSGVITNASKIREWKFPQAERAGTVPVEVWQSRLRHFAETMQRIRFLGPPEVRLDVRGDARQLASFHARLLMLAPGAQTPWGAAYGGRVTAKLFPTATNGLSLVEFNLQARDAQTRWGSITNLLLELRLASIPDEPELANCTMKLSARVAQTQWGTGSNALFTAQWVHSMTNAIPLSGHGQLQCGFAQTEWASATGLRLAGGLTRSTVSIAESMSDPGLSWWTNLEAYALEWQGNLTNLHSAKLDVQEVAAGGTWRAPLLEITNLVAKIYDAPFSARATLDVVQRALAVKLASELDPQNLQQLLPESGRRWLEQFTWDAPPRLAGDISLILPAWTNREPDWQAEIQPTLQLRGEFAADRGGALRGWPIAAAHSHFIYSNQTWTLPDLVITRPEGSLTAEHHADDKTKDFYWRLSSTLDLTSLGPLLPPDAQEGLDLFSFTEAPAVEAEIWGRYHDGERTGFRGKVALTNFQFRGESFTGVQTSLGYTNRILRFLQPNVQRRVGRARADGLTADFNKQFVYLTNAHSTVDPMVIARVIGAHIARAIEPYVFSNPPVGHVYGMIPLHGEAGADVHFELDGGPFHWWKFNLKHIRGEINWLGSRLILTNLQADFYQGQAAGDAAFSFVREGGPDFDFVVGATNVLLQALMGDLSSHSNHLEGRLNGLLAVTKANTDDWRSVYGYGELNLRDGLIWDIPIFGIFSPVLNGIAPGLGNSRATAGSCGFVLTNGVIYTDDLHIRTPTMRMAYRGTVDLQSQVHARVEAELLRDVWLVGPLVSTVLWPVTKLFEYKVKGELEDPQTEPVFIVPRLMLFPFHPLRTLKGLLPGNSGANHPNAPPK
jgi:hypothetical protein